MISQTNILVFLVAPRYKNTFQEIIEKLGGWFPGKTLLLNLKKAK